MASRVNAAHNEVAILRLGKQEQCHTVPTVGHTCTLRHTVWPVGTSCSTNKRCNYMPVCYCRWNVLAIVGPLFCHKDWRQPQ